MRSSRDVMATRALWVLVTVGCAGMATAAVFALASGGYEPNRYRGTVDPIRTSLLVAFAAGALAFGLPAGAGMVSRRSARRGARPASLIAVPAGLAIICVALVLIVLWIPSPTPASVPVPIRIVLFLGIGVWVIGMAGPTTWGLAEAMERRRRGLLVALAILVLVVAWRLVSGA